MHVLTQANKNITQMCTRINVHTKILFTSYTLI